MGTVMAGQEKHLNGTLMLALLLLSSLFILPTSQEHDDAGRETSKHKGGNQDKGRSGSESALQVSTAAGQEDVLKAPPTLNNKLVGTAMCRRRPGNSEAIGTNEWSAEGFSLSLRWCEACCPVREHPACCFNPICKKRRPRQWKEKCRHLEWLRHGRNSLQNVSSNPLRNGAETEHSVTLCDVAGGSSQMLSLEDLDADEASNLEEAKCAFILHEDDTTATCSDLAPHCDQRFSIATIACWKLNWCPRKIGRKYNKLKGKKKDGGICCFHPKFKNRRECAWRKSM